MGAGKTTIGREVARLTHRPFVDTDAEIEKEHGPIPALFEERGEAEFRRIEEQAVFRALLGEPAVLALGGGAVLSEGTRERLRGNAFTVWLQIDVETAWERARGSGRPLARGEQTFRALYEERLPVYDAAADASRSDPDGVLLAALQVVFGGGLDLAGPVAVVADEGVARLHEPPVDGSVLEVPSGEAAKDLAVASRLWEQLELGRDGTIVAFGGGSTTDLAGFVAATYLRGVPWLAVPTTLTAQVDAAIGGKTGLDVGGKNRVGAFHFPYLVVVEPAYLATLPERERRAGMAEVVKTGLLAGEPVWDLPEEEMLRACAAYKCGVVLSDPYETEGRRTILNLGHTFAHALEAASDFEVGHGEAVALGLLAALRLSGVDTDVVESVLRPEPVHVDREAAWAALKRDKKGDGVFVLLEEPGRPIVTTVGDRDARAALNSLIAK